MKFLFLTISILISINIGRCATSETVLINGRIDNYFDEKIVKVKDSLGQTFYIPRQFLSEGIKLEQGELFSIEVADKDIGKIKRTRK